MSKSILCAGSVLFLLVAGAADHPYGGIKLIGTFDVDGMGRVADTTIWPESYPTQYRVKAVLEVGECIYSYTVPDDAQGVRFPQMDESIWLMPPMTADNVMTVGVEKATAQIYVAPNGTDADGYGGSASMPYQTLAYAVSKAPSTDKSRTVIHAAAGDYASGTGMYAQTPARVLIDRHVRLKGAGRGKSVIWGANDTTSGEADACGCGPEAVRCVQFSSFDKSCVQGFTLRDGRSGLSSDTNERKKGGIVCKGAANMICDCLVTNCFGYNTSVAFGGTIVRSIITCNDNVSQPSTAASVSNGKDLRLICCIVRQRSIIGSAAALGTGCAYQSTLIGDRFDPAQDGAYGVKDPAIARNCAIGEGSRSLNAGKDIADCVFWDATSVDASYFPANIRFGSSADKSSPYLYRIDADDCRPATASPVIGAGRLDADYYRTYSADVNGNPILFVDGRPTVGAVHTLVKTLVVPKSGGSATLTVLGVANITNAVDTGDSVTLTLTDMTRPGGSFVINGETVRGPSHTFVVGDETPDPLLITNVTFTTDWYVDAVNGDDANTGFYPGAGYATRTLCSVLTNSAFAKGDTLHAAAGEYAEGSVSGSGLTRCRVEENRHVVADEGPEKTFIIGAASTDAGRDADGCGPGAVRCVSMGKNATLTGFTLTGGRTAISSDGSGTGGAAVNNALATMRNCIISNNVATYRSGAVDGGTLVNCRVFNNKNTNGTNGGSIIRGAKLYGCVIDYMYGSQHLAECNYIYNSTIGSNCLNKAGTAAQWCIYYPAANANLIANSICLAKYGSAVNREIIATNSVFANYGDAAAQYTILGGTSYVTNKGAAILDETYALLPGCRDLIDGGDTSIDVSTLNGTDVYGGQRVYNGVIDIGAVEHDWRPEYRADLVRKADCTVTAASANAVEDGAAVKLPPDGALTLCWKLAPGAGKGRLTVTASVVGSGSLDAYVNGVLVETRTAASEPMFGLTTRTAENEVVFKYIGTDGFARLDEMAALLHGVQILIR